MSEYFSKCTVGNLLATNFGNLNVENLYNYKYFKKFMIPKNNCFIFSRMKMIMMLKKH